MASIEISSASVSRREKILETGKKIILLFYVSATKIKEAGVNVVAAIKIIGDDLLKESLGIFYDWFSWFLASIFALKFTATGKTFFSANHSVLKAIFLIRFISFLTTLLATLFEMHKKNIAPLLLMLVFESGASISAASLFSWPTLFIPLTLWLCIFVLFGFCCYPEVKELILRIQEMV